MKNVAMAIVFKDDEVLLVHRRFPPQLWGPPAGFAEKGETYEHAAVRETFEETGIVCSALGFLGTIPYKKHHSMLHIYACEYLSGCCRCSIESRDVGWFRLDCLPDPYSPPEEIILQAREMIRRANEK